MQAGMGITDGIIQGKISCFRNKFHKHKEKCSEKRKFLGALCLRSERKAKLLSSFLFCHFLYSLHRFHIIERTLSVKSDFAIIHDLFGTSDKQHTTLGQ